MQKTPLILITLLASVFSFTPAQADSVERILDELSNYQGVQTDSVAKETQPDAASPNEEIDVPAIIDESRDLYAGGEFERAQAGFESVITSEPENLVARMYLRKILERDSRRTEVSGMEAVTTAWDTDLVLRSYETSRSAVEKMELGEIDGAVDISAKFPEVAFPQGASAVFQPRSEKIFVRNTRDNLTVLEEILDAMDIANISADVEQVEIEAKFVEISEGTLEELGFQWFFQDNSVDLGGDVALDTSANNGLFDDALRTMPYDIPNTLGAGGTAAQAADTAWRTFRFEDTFSPSAPQMTLQKEGYTPLDIVISALDQSSGADVLSAPRVTTRSGEEAIIRVGEKHYFPEIFEPDADGGNIVHAVYTDWEETLLGVELAVTPQMDGNQIEMQLNPKILDLQGYQTYDIAPANSAYTVYQGRIRQSFKHDAIKAKLPIFGKRMLETEVTIADGATMAMGGLINEEVEAFEDKVPVLGSLPLVGRLFRTEGERSVKRNLMMFVTAKRVEPTGRINSARSF